MSFFDHLALREGVDTVVEQTPINLYYREEIRRDFPNAVFILLCRDPRAIISSQKMRWKVGRHGRRHIPELDIARVRYSGHPLIQLVLLRKTIKEIRKAMTEDDVMLIAYEDLASDPERILANVVQRIGLNFEPDMLAVKDSGSSHVSEEGKLGFDPTRMGKWQGSLTETEIWLAEKIYRNSLLMPISGAKPRLSEALRLVLSLPWYLAMSVHYSSNGYVRLIDAFKRRFW